MSKIVVDLFEAVEIKGEQKQRIARFPRPRDFFRQSSLSETPIIQSGQRVKIRQSVKLFPSNTVLCGGVRLFD
jgi:hypothetical protein